MPYHDIPINMAEIISFMYRHNQSCILQKEPHILSEFSSSFTLFPLLPAELRLKIWKMVTAHPRSVELSCTLTSFYLPGGRWFSHSKPPVIFSICLESRMVALETFSTLHFSPLHLGAPCRNPLYINFASETLWLCGDLHEGWARALLEKNEQLKKKLRFLAVKESAWKELNQIDLTPTWSDGSDAGKESPKSVVVGLKALESIRFHS